MMLLLKKFIVSTKYNLNVLVGSNIYEIYLNISLVRSQWYVMKRYTFKEILLLLWAIGIRYYCSYVNLQKPYQLLPYMLFSVTRDLVLVICKYVYCRIFVQFVSFLSDYLKVINKMLLKDLLNTVKFLEDIFTELLPSPVLCLENKSYSPVLCPENKSYSPVLGVDNKSYTLNITTGDETNLNYHDGIGPSSHKWGENAGGQQWGPNNQQWGQATTQVWGQASSQQWGQVSSQQVVYEPRSDNQIPIEANNSQERCYWKGFMVDRRDSYRSFGNPNAKFDMHPDLNVEKFASKKAVYDWTVSMYDNHKREDREGSPGEAEYFANRFTSGAKAYRYYDQINAQAIAENKMNPSTPEREPGYPFDFRGASPVRTTNPDLVLQDREGRQDPNANHPSLPVVEYMDEDVPRYRGDLLRAKDSSFNVKQMTLPPSNPGSEDELEPSSSKRKHEENLNSDQEQPKLKYFKFNSNNGGNNNGEGPSGWSGGNNPNSGGGGSSGTNFKTMTEFSSTNINDKQSHNMNEKFNKEENNINVWDKVLIFLASTMEIISSALENLL